MKVQLKLPAVRPKNNHRDALLAANCLHRNHYHEEVEACCNALGCTGDAPLALLHSEFVRSLC